MRLASTLRGGEHRVTVPRYRQLEVGTLSGIISDVASYVGLTSNEVRWALFGDA